MVRPRPALSATFTDFPTFSADLADDFIVPARADLECAVDRRRWVVFQWRGTCHEFQCLLLRRQRDSSWHAGLFGHSTSRSRRSARTFTVNLAVAAVLAAGTYWVEMQANLTFATQGGVGLDRPNGAVEQHRGLAKPGGGFAACPSRTRKLTCIPTAGGPDQVFRLNGTIVGARHRPAPTPGTPTPPAPPAPRSWLTWSIANSDPTQIDRLFRSGIPGSCGHPLAHAQPSAMGSPTITIRTRSTNTTGSTQCVTVDTNTACTGTNFIFTGRLSGQLRSSQHLHQLDCRTSWRSPNPDQVFAFDVANGQTFVPCRKSRSAT